MKRIIFEGMANGEAFNNINEYNARVKQLMDSGEFKSASSSTRVEEYETSGFIREVNDNTSCTEIPKYNGAITTTLDTAADTYDDELTRYPFMEEDEEFYLDQLVSDNADKNKDRLKEVDRILTKCWNYIDKALHNPETEKELKTEYLEDVKQIIEELTDDKEDTLETIKSINKRHQELWEEYDKRFKALDDEYNKENEKLDSQLFILKESKPVIDKLLEFYRALQLKLLLNIKESQKEECKCKECECKCEPCECNGDCTCDKEKQITDIITELIEKFPQEAADISSLFGRIFGPIRNLK